VNILGFGLEGSWAFSAFCWRAEQSLQGAFV